MVGSWNKNNEPKIIENNGSRYVSITAFCVFIDLSPSRYTVTAKPVFKPPSNNKSIQEVKDKSRFVPIKEGNNKIADVKYIQKARMGLLIRKRVLLERIIKCFLSRL